MEEQITDFVKKYLSPFLCGYRKGFSTQHTLLALIEKWRKIMDKKGFGGAVLMDLSKAFDTIDHELLLAKLHAYGFDERSLRLFTPVCLTGGNEQRLIINLVHGQSFYRVCHKVQF